MKSEFMIARQGKQFVLFAGLLDEAHAQGLKSIETQILEKPNEMNGKTAIVHARVTLEGDKVFEGIGDASPENVGRNIAPHLIRMAETRAKARALRDAINIGVTALEELGGEEEQEQRKPKASGSRSNVTDMRRSQKQASEATFGSPSNAAKGEMPATRKQLNYLEGLIEDAVADGMPKFEEMVGKKIGELTREEASEWIGRLSGKAAP